MFDLVQNSFLDQHCRLLIDRGFYCPQDFDALQPKNNNDFPNQLARLCENYGAGEYKKLKECVLLDDEKSTEAIDDN